MRQDEQAHVRLATGDPRPGQARCQADSAGTDGRAQEEAEGAADIRRSSAEGLQGEDFYLIKKVFLREKGLFKIKIKI